MIIDVTVLDVLDSFASRTLRMIAEMVRLRGAETVIVGIQPDVAFAMVQLGLTLDGVTTVLDLEEGLAHLERSRRTQGRGRPWLTSPSHPRGLGRRAPRAAQGGRSPSVAGSAARTSP